MLIKIINSCNCPSEGWAYRAGETVDVPLGRGHMLVRMRNAESLEPSVISPPFVPAPLPTPTLVASLPVASFQPLPRRKAR